MNTPTTPTPSPEPVLTTYFAVQMLRLERPKDVAGAVCRAGQEAGTLFRRLEVLDTITIGATPFVRFRSDVINPYPMLMALAAKRGHVAVKPTGGYSAKLLGGRTGDVPGTTMNAAPRGATTIYRGPRIKMWDRQFQDE